MEERLQRTFEHFEQMTSTIEGQLILALPVTVLVIIILAYAIAVTIKRSKEKGTLLKDMELKDSEVDNTDVVSSLKPLGAPSPEKVPEPVAVKPEPEPEPAPVPVPEPKIPEVIAEVRGVDKQGWLARLRSGLSKTRSSLESSVGSLFSGKTKIDDDVLEKLHEGLFRADIGVKTADKLVDHVRTSLSKSDAADWEQVGKALKEHAASLMQPAATKELNTPTEGPWVILVVGVNGVGKTTTIGKLAANFISQDKKVLLAAADTFRAAAIDQLCVWADRLGVDVVKHKPGADPAAVAFDAVKSAKARNADVLLIDTAGRLHNRNELMAELGKINKVVGKDLPGAPHETWLVIDATTGQNAVQQVRAFKDVVDLSGLVVTKLDGTAKGGVVIGITDQFQLPIRYVGVGEKAADLRQFEPQDFVEQLF